MKWGQTPFPSKRGRTSFLMLALSLASAALAAEPAHLLFTDNFETHTRNEHPGAPWSEATFKSGAVIKVDADHAFSGQQALHIFTPHGARYRRGYVALHLKGTVPDAMPGMYGRAMFFLDAAPVALAGAPPVHWTLMQGEGRSADDRYNSIYRLGVEGTDGLGLMANFETTPPVTTDCKQPSSLRLPVRRWTCVEWHMEVASNEMQFWLDGHKVVHVTGRPKAANVCRGNDLQGEWRAPPKFDSLYIGFERYADSANDQDLWVDDVAMSKRRVGCAVQK
jgi:polysaccharide lyase-like protein